MKTITFPLKYFLENHLLGELDSTSVPEQSAMLIKASDNDEQFVHVQYDALSHLTNYDSKNPPLNIKLEGEKLKRPLIWWKPSWDIHYPKVVKDTVNKFTERKRNNINTENIQRIAKYFRASMHINEEESMRLASEMYKATPAELFKLMGIKIESL